MNVINREANKAKKEIIEIFLLENDWDISKSARELRIDRSGLHRYIKRYGLKRPEVNFDKENK